MHRAYAERALVKVPSLGEYERQPEKGKIVSVSGLFRELFPFV